ncbi:YggS family pyridoxal phosphate-dependent enzyme [Xenorhabdus sp. 18]|nr:YggS family pyridoxal phosphate-dependent enzyme [Xenorhabdus sp. 18]
MVSMLEHLHYPSATTLDDFKFNLSSVKQRILEACQRVDRNPSTVRLLPVSKTVSPERIRIAYDAGIRQFGENKAQEAYSKWKELANLDDIRWTMIGHLQTNKAKFVAHFASEFQALDSLKVAEELDRHLQRLGRSLDVFIQVNTSGEASKYGLPPEAVMQFLHAMPVFNSLQVKGLMTLATFSNDVTQVRSCFIRLKKLRDQLLQVVTPNIKLEELSMGMSGDFEIAIEEGATVVRVGQAIYGSRTQPNAYYWPK